MKFSCMAYNIQEHIVFHAEQKSCMNVLSLYNVCFSPLFPNYELKIVFWTQFCVDKSQVGSCKESPRVYVLPPHPKVELWLYCYVHHLDFFKIVPCGHFCVQHRLRFPSLTASNGTKWIPIICYCKLVLNTSEENL